MDHALNVYLLGPLQHETFSTYVIIVADNVEKWNET